MSLNPIDWLTKMIYDLASDIASACFSWLKIFLLDPTDFSKYSAINSLFIIISTLSITCGALFFIYNLIKLMIQKAGGYESRTVSEITVKTLLGTTMGFLSPLILTNVLLKVNNEIVDLLVKKGVTVEKMSAMLITPAGRGVAEVLALLFLAFTFLLLTFQYIVRLGEILMLYIYAPICAVSSVNEEMNAFGIWYREAFCTVFTQAFQLSIFWLIFNVPWQKGANDIQNVFLTCGLMIIVIKGPGFLRKFLYSTGSARKVIGAAGEVTKAQVIKFISSKFMK